MAAINTQTVLYNESFYDSTFEHPCESETTLPEYLPDVASIVRVDARPVLLDTAYRNGRVEIDGRVECIILYLPNEGTLQSFFTRIPFEATVSEEEFGPDMRFYAHVRMDSVRCRPLSGRKLSVRCTVSITLQGEKTREMPLVSTPDIEAQKLELLEQSQKAACYVESSREQFSLEEMLELPSDSPRMERILKCDVNAYPLEIRVNTGKVVVGGELSVSCLYMSNVDTGATDQFSAKVPFNRVIEMPEVREGDVVCVGFVILESACGIMEDASGEERILSCKVGVQNNAVAYRNQDVTTVLDVYGKNQTVSVKEGEFDVELAQCLQCCDISVSDSFRPHEQIASLYSSEAFADVRELEYEEGVLHLRGDLLVSFLVGLQDGETLGLDHLFPFDVVCDQVAPGYEDGVFLGDCRLTELSYQMSSDGVVFVDAKLGCSILARLQRSIRAAQAVDLSPSQTPGQGKCLTLYYPSEGEALWDIGKRYATPVREIRQANSLEGDTVPKGVKMLLIPR